MSYFEYLPTCANCKHACWYPIPYMFPFYDPKCEIHKISIKPTNVCSNFELIGRHSK